MDQNITRISNDFSTSPQLQPEQLAALAAGGFKSVINNRPDGEGGAAQPTSAVIARAASSAGLEYAYLPVVVGKITADEVDTFARLLTQLPKPIVAFCRSGTRASTLYKMANQPVGAAAGPTMRAPSSSVSTTVDVLVIGGGATGLGVIASLLKRQSDLRITVVEPNEKHYYQPAWTLVGAGEFDQKKTMRPMADCIPRGATWVLASTAAFEPEQNRVVLDNGQRLEYRTLIVCPGLKLDWEGDQATLRHSRFENVFSVGDVCSAPNAKTVAAARKQVVVVAENLLAQCARKPMPSKYDGYGSCPLTVERGKIVLAEFGYGGKLLPTFPLDSTVPRRSAWLLKTRILPIVYWDGLLKGREWLARSSA